MVWFGMVQYIVWFGMVQYIVWFGMVQYIVWFGMVCLNTELLAPGLDEGTHRTLPCEI